MGLFDFDKILPLPLHLFGLKNLPGIPAVPSQWLGTLARLGEREVQVRSAARGLTNTYTIGGRTATGHAFLYGGEAENADAAAARDQLAHYLASNPLHATVKLFEAVAPSSTNPAPEAAAAPVSASSLTQLPLEDPAQFALSWTTYLNIYRDAQPLLADWSATLTDPATASKNFWPTIARYGLPYNLLILRKLDAASAAALQPRFGAAWTPALDTLVANGLLYAIDLSLFTMLQPQQVAGLTRFTPATVTLLSQDSATKALTPVAVWVAGHDGAGAQVYAAGACTASAWLYALAAARTSVTLYGVWLGHVYQWHIVTAAMLMTMLNTIPQNTALYELLAPQSDYVMAFDNVLLLLWDFIAPPTSVTSVPQYLELSNAFAAGRQYFDDDPWSTLERLGLQESDFTAVTPWDQYPLVATLLETWQATAAYVDAFVEASYLTDASVAGDSTLQAWMTAAAQPDDGNVQGLPPMTTRAALRRVLTSLLFRIGIHGSSRAYTIANPGLSFVANFPPCLQDATIPAPTDTFDTRRLLQYLPFTGTIGLMMNFYNVFGFSVPYRPFVPVDGIDADLFFPGGRTDPRNVALIAYRSAIVALSAKLYAPHAAQLSQWPLNIET